MGRSNKEIAENAPARELAVFLRSVRFDSGLTLRTIATLGHQSVSTLSQNCDGRFRQWACTEAWIRALYRAVRHHGEVKIISESLTEHLAQHLWRIADARWGDKPTHPLIARPWHTPPVRAARSAFRLRSIRGMNRERPTPETAIGEAQSCEECRREGIRHAVDEQEIRAALKRTVSSPPHPGRDPILVYRILVWSKPEDREALLRLVTNWMHDRG